MELVTADDYDPNNILDHPPFRFALRHITVELAEKIIKYFNLPIGVKFLTASGFFEEDYCGYFRVNGLIGKSGKLPNDKWLRLGLDYRQVQIISGLPLRQEIECCMNFGIRGMEEVYLKPEDLPREWFEGMYFRSEFMALAYETFAPYHEQKVSVKIEVPMKVGT